MTRYSVAVTIRCHALQPYDYAAPTTLDKTFKPLNIIHLKIRKCQFDALALGQQLFQTYFSYH